MATAELRETVKRIIGQTGGELQSSQNLTALDEGGFKRVAIRIAVKVTIQELQSLLYQIEALRPYLLVETLEIKSRRTRRREQARGGIAETQPLPLLARLDIYGYIQPKAEP